LEDFPLTTPQGIRPRHNGILILDFGSQYTLLIARRLREIGVYAEIIDGASLQGPAGFEIDGIILSGGPDSVSAAGSRGLPPWVLASKKPLLGVCYGMQLLVENFGGRLRSGQGREYGRADLHLNFAQLGSQVGGASMFSGLPTKQVVWMSHGDDLHEMPKGFHAVGTTGGDVVAAIAHETLPYVGLQFHPEVVHSEYGKEILQNFVSTLCQAKLNWQPDDMVTGTQDYIRQTVGDGRVLMAVSGGVDSTVAAVLLAKTLGPERVTAVFVDHGLLRKNEAPWVVENLNKLGLEKITLLDEKKYFLDQLRGVSDPETKRKIIGRCFIERFEAFAKSHLHEFTHLGQGTLYPDVIESAGHGAGAKVIKSHHNVGGLPEHLALKLVEPFRFCFKDEVRKIGLELGIDQELIGRHPFPGPGLAVRILGDISEEKIAILQEADAIFIESLKKHKHYDDIWQAFAVLLPVKTVGVMGDNRTYQWTCALRAVAGSDAMTASVSALPWDFLTDVAGEIVRRVDGINRVVYDVTNKPPATIEWE